jgi:ketosteroid isomerase-like protein
LDGRLQRALGDETRSWTYAQPDIKEILVFGDIAVVRLTWISTVTGGPEGAVKSVEPGMDLFRRQPNGSWKIMRYMAFSQ